jgi:hypothetical protein
MMAVPSFYTLLRMVGQCQGSAVPLLYYPDALPVLHKRFKGVSPSLIGINERRLPPFGR